MRNLLRLGVEQRAGELGLKHLEGYRIISCGLEMFSIQSPTQRGDLLQIHKFSLFKMWVRFLSIMGGK